jgi:hypothetical protein
MQPLRLARDPETGLVPMLNRRLSDMVSHGFGEGPQPFGAIPADRGDSGGRQRDAEQVGDQGGHPLLRQQLGMQQIHHESLDPCAVLHPSGNPAGKAARVRSPHFGQSQTCARCSVTFKG